MRATLCGSLLATLVAVPCLRAQDEAPRAGQSRDLVVTVIDSARGTPLEGAIVSIQGSTMTARTDFAGRVRLPGVGPRVTLTVRQIGFVERVLPVAFGEEGPRELQVALVALQVLPRVEVRAAAARMPREIETRQKLGGGYLYDTQDIERIGQVREVLRRTPNTVVGSAATAGRGFSGGALPGEHRLSDLSRAGSTAEWVVMFPLAGGTSGCYADVYIDGRTSGDMPRGGSPTEKFQELRSLSPKEIYAIEVFPRGTRAPIDKVRSRGGCGLILVWTKWWVEKELAAEQRRQSRAQPDTLDMSERAR